MNVQGHTKMRSSTAATSAVQRTKRPLEPEGAASRSAAKREREASYAETREVHSADAGEVSDEEADGDDDDGDDGEAEAIAAFNAKTAPSAEAAREPVAPKTFAELGVCAPLCEACTALGWKAPTPVQVEAIPIALGGRDVIGLAETGSGKTGAFALPILQALLDSPQRMFACILAPTRELAFQISEQFDALGAAIGLRTAVLVGGVDMMTQAIALARKPHVIVGTPGRVVDHLENSKGFSLRSIRFLVMDEADRMLSMDFEEPIEKILRSVPRERRTLLFSATMTSKVAKLQRASLVDPVKVEVSSKYDTAAGLIQQFILCPQHHKDAYLVALLNDMAGQTAILFAATCAATQRLVLVLRNLGFSATALHGQMSQSRRLAALNAFRAGDKQLLIATDVASRGLDIPSVDLVVNYDVPASGKDYVHRVGRTARAGRAGRAVTLVTQYDVEVYQRIEHLLGRKLPEYPTREADIRVILERVVEAGRLAAAQMREELSRGGGRGAGAKGRAMFEAEAEMDEGAAASAVLAESSERRHKLAKAVRDNKSKARPKRH